MLDKRYLSIADLLIPVSFLYDETAERYYRDFLCRDISGLSEADLRSAESRMIVNTAEELEAEKKETNRNGIYTEHCLIMKKTADLLLSHNRCLFHGVSILWKGKALIFTGPSGVGKSTQYQNWKSLYGDEIRILNGYKPVLWFKDDGSVLVCPSPWKGKEGWASMERGFLKEIVCLEQGWEDRYFPLEGIDRIMPVFTQIMFTYSCTEDIDLACICADRLLRNVPITKLINRGDDRSAALLHDCGSWKGVEDE
jgi:hypothetical protein